MENELNVQMKNEKENIEKEKSIFDINVIE